MAFLSALLTRTFLKAAGVDAFDRRAGLGVEDGAGGRLVGDEMIGGIDQQPVVAERVQDRRRLRRRLGGQFADRLLALRKLVVEESGQRVVERVGASRALRRRATTAQRRVRAERADKNCPRHHAQRDDGRSAASSISYQLRHWNPVDYRSGASFDPGGESAGARAGSRRSFESCRLPGGTTQRRQSRRPMRLASASSAPHQPPHLPVLTLKLPHDIGLRQSAIRSFEPSR